jgi:3-vinyl bacteriochlorophyllide hydratase
MPTGTLTSVPSRQLYTSEERARRDSTIWTTVQGVLAPLQFVVFLVSLGLVLRFLMTGTGYDAATASIILKTVVLLTIMVTGAIWEKVVFWEDIVSFLVIALHLAYVWALIAGWSHADQMWIALAAYTAYVLNAAQFIWKLRMARLDAEGRS